jgi:hypothetical protein
MLRNLLAELQQWRYQFCRTDEIVSNGATKSAGTFDRWRYQILMNGATKSAGPFEWLPNLQKLFREGRYGIAHSHYTGLALRKLQTCFGGGATKSAELFCKGRYRTGYPMRY